MLKVVAKKQVENENREKILQLLQTLAEESRKDQGCIRYGLYQDINDTSVITIIEEWEDQNCLEKHFNTAHFKELVPRISALADQEEVNIYQEI